jgi:hypothetical protein
MKAIEKTKKAKEEAELFAAKMNKAAASGKTTGRGKKKNNETIGEQSENTNEESGEGLTPGGKNREFNDHMSEESAEKDVRDNTFY